MAEPIFFRRGEFRGDFQSVTPMSTADERDALIAVLDPLKDVEMAPEDDASELIADALLAAGYRKVEAAPSDTDREQVTPEALAAKLYSIEYQVDPDSATPDDIDERLGAADELIAWFAARASQPVQVEVTDDMVKRGQEAWTLSMSRAEGYRKAMRAALSAALAGGK